MYKKDVIEYFGSVRQTAEALQVTYQLVQQWNDIIPVKQAVKLHNLTGGKLVLNPKLYE